MSWSLQLHNGDLSVGGSSLGIVTDETKLVQDLRCALLEERGTDEFHPTFGSIVDGGINERGQYIPSVIGISDWNTAALRIEVEIRRICAEYQAAQIERSKRDRMTYGQSTLSSGELLVNIAGIEMLQAEDKLLVQVALTTGNGQQTRIDIPLSDPMITT